jgi:hypothetical protein
LGNLRTTTPDIEAIVLYNLTGLSLNKMNFLAGALSINHNAVLIAVIIPLVFLIENKTYRYIFLFINIGTLFYIDSRSALLSLIIVAFFFKVLKPRKVKEIFIRLMVFVLPVLGLIVYYVTPALSYLDMFSFLSRNNADLFTANSRTIIWDFVISDISQISRATIFGSGSYGNLAFDSSLFYLNIFNNFADSDVKTSHNTFFQLVLDNGYIYLILYLGFIFRTLNLIGKISERSFSNPLSFSILVFLLCGVSEVLIGFYYVPITFVFFVVCIYLSSYNYFVLGRNALQSK